MNWKFTVLYVAAIVAVNYGFTVIPPVILPGGVVWPPVALLVGLVFVLRDFAQREAGHYVIAAMLLGALLSYVMAGPEVALASTAAFLASEFADWAVYSFTGRTLSQRVLWSSAVSTPLDSAVFLWGIGLFSLPVLAAMTASKMVGALIVWWLLRRREALA